MPVAVVMISRDEAHNMEAVLENLDGWAKEVFLVDSFSRDETVDIAVRRGVHVVQRRFEGFGNQWNFALEHLPVTAPWTMKLDPDERLTSELKDAIRDAIENGDADGLVLRRRLWFMGRALPIRQELVRVWRTGRARFSNVLVNEHPIVDGTLRRVRGELEHHDSPHLHHWYTKQNFYSTAEARSAFEDRAPSATPSLFGGPLARRMWLKKHFHRIPFRFFAVFLYYYLVKGTWRAGRVGRIWARLRADVYRTRLYKRVEMELRGNAYIAPAPEPGPAHPAAIQIEEPPSGASRTEVSRSGPSRTHD